MLEQSYAELEETEIAPVGIWSSFCGRPRKGLSWMPLGRDRPGVEKPVGACPTPPEGDAADTHNGLRSHGRFRCLVIRFRRPPWSGIQQIPAGGELDTSKGVPGCNGPVKKGRCGGWMLQQQSPAFQRGALSISREPIEGLTCGRSQLADCSAAIRDSRGGWLLNSAIMPPPAIPLAAISFGN